MTQDTFNKIDSVYKRLEASKGKISYAIICKEAKTSMRSVSEYFKVREGRISITATNGSGSASLYVNTFSSNLPFDLESLKRLKELKEEELAIITDLYNRLSENPTHETCDSRDFNEEVDTTFQYRNKVEEDNTKEVIEGFLNKEDLTIQAIQDSINYLFEEFRSLEALKNGYLYILKQINKSTSIFYLQEAENLKQRFIEFLIKLSNLGNVTSKEMEQTFKEVDLVNQYQEYLAA